MNTREFVATLTLEEITEIIKDQESFEKQGFIGDSLLRTKTAEMMNAMFGDSESFSHSGITIWMTMLITEVYRRLAYQYLKFLTKE